ncbi:hypothetical protein KHS38_12945 [Mucilaginibacter sp. Bleaf8]|uniref:hypothetical protein n=1 Tax=Mucilaginibacter sp. Bleaf8 TaxID=2834430 RepID=UPI001BCBBCCB|nr:hypothetical protein [Mucilaginibacter sp. Bleaf8]MBS7565313.1 hypothetical protein [Mucilaginibacter sp. Bleaf8]
MKLNTWYKIFELELDEVKKESGNFPLQSIVPYGPSHPDKQSAKAWLADNMKPDKKYVITKIYDAAI